MELIPRGLSISTYLLLPLLWFGLPCFSQPGAQKPNIIFIMADDLGAETLGCYGNQQTTTPHLNRMASMGMRFTEAHATPLCSPTRVQLMTGKYNFRNYTGFGLLDPAEQTFAHLLKEAGYVTGITGKWQLLGNAYQRKLAGGKKGSYPQEAGFDTYCLWQVDSLGPRYKDPVISTPAGTRSYPGSYGPDVFTKYAEDFIEKNRDTTFFLYYPMVLTHDPFQPTPESPGYAEFDSQKNSSDTLWFRDMVGYMDKLVGKIIAKVQKEGISHRTLIIFSGDNGTSNQVYSLNNGKYVQGQKGTSTRHGTHVPLIAWWDGVIPAGRINDNLVDFTDFLPTFLEVAGKKLPDQFHTDGLSIRDQLLNVPNAKVRKWIYCAYDPRWGTMQPATWVHDKSWKLYQDNRVYNLAEDPLETNPIPYAKLPKSGQKMIAEFRKVLAGYR